MNEHGYVSIKQTGFWEDGGVNLSPYLGNNCTGRILTILELRRLVKACIFPGEDLDKKMW